METSLFQNLDAEKAVLGLIIADDSFTSLVPQLMDDDFSITENQAILKAMRKLYIEKRPIDLLTLFDVFSKQYPVESKALNQLTMEYARSIITEKYHIKEYISLIKEAAMRRKFLKVIEDAKKELCETGSETSAVLDRTRQNLRNIIMTKHSWEGMSEVMSATLTAIEKRARGEEPSMPSGIGSLDLRMAGFHKGELTIIGARPAVGKSALGAHIALASAQNGYRVGVCSREMTDVQYGTRILSRESGVVSDHLRTGELKDDEWASIVSACGDVGNLPIDFMFSARFIEDLRMEVQKKVDEGNLDMLVVDYTQLMQSRQRFEKDYMRIGYVSKMLKDMTTDFNISVVALAQVGRSAENTMPTLAELRGSGDLEQDADNVIFMHRPTDASDKYVHPEDKATFNNLKAQGLQYIALNIAKQRQGDIGTTAVHFDPTRMRYTEIERRSGNGS